MNQSYYLKSQTVQANLQTSFPMWSEKQLSGTGSHVGLHAYLAIL